MVHLVSRAEVNREFFFSFQIVKRLYGAFLGPTLNPVIFLTALSTGTGWKKKQADIPLSLSLCILCLSITWSYTVDASLMEDMKEVK